MEDQVVWTMVKDGRFSVKSLYKALELKRLGDLELFGASEGEFF